MVTRPVCWIVRAGKARGKGMYYVGALSFIAGIGVLDTHAHYARRFGKRCDATSIAEAYNGRVVRLVRRRK